MSSADNTNNEDDFVNIPSNDEPDNDKSEPETSDCPLPDEDGLWLKVKNFLKDSETSACYIEDDDDSIRSISCGTVIEVTRLIAEEGQRIHQRMIDTAKNKLAFLKQGPKPGQKSINVNTLYKRKGVKVHPRDDIPSDGSVPNGDPYWKEKRWKEVQGLLDKESKYPDYITPKFSTIETGSRIYGERKEKLLDGIRNNLSEEEMDIFMQIMFNREAALAWDFTECGSVDPIVAPPQVIKVTEHKAWQAGSIPIPKGLEKKVIELLRIRMKRKILEESYASYRNPWFLVTKKDGGLCLINSATRINAFTICDSLIPIGADEFSADFGMCRIISVLDFFSGYDQVPLDEKSRDLTIFNTPIGLLRMCTLPQGATNSVAQFIRVITRILFDLIPDVCRLFLDDIAVKGLLTTYNEEEVLPGVRRFVLEHLINIDKVLVNIELAGCTISAVKSQFCQQTAKVVGYLCGTYGCQPTDELVVKINEWESCDDISEVRVFLGLVGYYRRWVLHFAWIAEPLIKLLKKGAEWE